MKKNIFKILAIMLIAIMSFGVCACSVDMGTDDESEVSSSHEYTGDEVEINISVYAAGFGQGWIDEACRIYERDNPGYRFKIRANSRMFDTIKTELSNDVCTSDIVLVAGYDYLNLATRGKLAELSSVYSSKIPDSTKTVKDVVAKEQYEYRLVGENNDKIYGIPWQDTPSNGFIYNKKMFADNGWEVPETMDEFFALCDEIAKTGVAPLVYGGGQQDGYMQMTPEQWLVQYYGHDYMQNTFEQYLTPEQYKDTEAGRTKAYQYAAKVLKGNASNGNPIALTGSNAFTAQAAQREFIKGNAAMDLCGVWFPTEMKSILKDYPDFEYGYFPTPHINADKKDVNGNDTSTESYILAANLLCIPANAPHIDVAKDFLLSMFTSESYTTFVSSNNGLTRPIDVSVDISALNDFAKSVYNSLAPAKSNGKCVYETSLSPMATNGYLGLMNFSGTDAYLSMINSANYESALSIANSASQNDYNTAKSFWDSKTNNWDKKYLGVE